jgi:hypothetical protein
VDKDSPETTDQSEEKGKRKIKKEDNLFAMTF